MGFLFAPVFRLTPENGAPRVIALNATTLSDAHEPTVLGLRYEPESDERLDVLREARSAIFGVRPYTDLAVEIGRTLDQDALSEIVCALMDDRWTVELSLDGGVGYREEELVDWGIEPLADKWFAGHRCTLEVRGRELMTTVPRPTVYVLPPWEAPDLPPGGGGGGGGHEPFPDKPPVW